MNPSSRLCVTVALLVVAAIGLVQTVRAQAYPTTIGGVLCDTQDALRALVAANQRSADAVRALFQQRNTQLDAKNQPTCSTQQVQHDLLSVPHSIDFGPWSQNGQALEASAVRIQAGGIDGWFMYTGLSNLSGRSGPSNGI